MRMIHSALRFDAMLCLVIGAALSLGCHEVRLKQPIGGEAVPLEGKLWEGDWQLRLDKNSTTLHTALSEKEPGALIVAAVEINKSSETIAIEQSKVWARPWKQYWFLS